ncbi:hypothetical protein ES705_41333 [subsurface metagenome]
MGAYVIISCPKTDISVSRTSAAVEVNTDMIVNVADLPAGRKGRLRIQWAGFSATRYVDLYDRFGAAPIAGSQISEVRLGYGLDESNPFTLPEGLKSFQARLWSSPSGMTVEKIELQIESF